MYSTPRYDLSVLDGKYSYRLGIYDHAMVTVCYVSFINFNTHSTYIGVFYRVLCYWYTDAVTIKW